jgi:hypothetical protein
MKIGGVDPKTMSTEEFLVLPRGEENIIFRAVGVPNYDPFNKLCPEPTPPKVHKPKEGWVDNEEEPGYKDMMKTYGKKRLAWLVITSLEPSEIEWDEVNLDKPATWLKWSDELSDSGFNQVEVNRIQNLVFQANCLDEDKLEQARESFQLGQQPVPSEYSGLSIAPESTPPGELASE